MEQITTVGIVLAKSAFSLHGSDGAGRVALRRTMPRNQLAWTEAALRPCLTRTEAFSGAHEWGRTRPDDQGTKRPFGLDRSGTPAGSGCHAITLPRNRISS